MDDYQNWRSFSCENFESLVRALDREDMDKLWKLVKDRFKTADAEDDKDKELWVELHRLYEPDSSDKHWRLEAQDHKIAF